MDSSLSKALIIAGGILVAMLVVAFVTYSFNHMGRNIESQGDAQDVEQIQEFNREYEIYDKDLMFGVDVISCLNKAKSNNDKIEEKYAEKLDPTYKIEVTITFKNNLEEAIRIYHMNSNGKPEEYVGSNQPTEDRKKLNEVFSVSNKIKAISNIDFTKKLYQVSGCQTKVSAGTYKLTGSDNTLVTLIGLSDELKQTRKNDFSGSHSENVDSWSVAEWETPLYNMKTRKFKCTAIGYNAKNSRVNSISFQEL